MRVLKNNQRGDTLIEVLIAITVLGAIVAGCLAVMNRSLVSILNSAERTASRSDINTETDLLNYVYRNDKATWSKIMNVAYVNNANSTAPDNVKQVCTLNENSNADPTSKKQGSFYLKPTYDAAGKVSGVEFKDKLTLANNNGISELRRASIGEGLWVDAVYYPQNAVNQRSYVDFYIKACWVPLGGSSGAASETNSRSVTVARIYNYSDDDNGSYVPPTTTSYLNVGQSYNEASHTITFSWDSPTLTSTCPAHAPPEYQYKLFKDEAGEDSVSWVLRTTASGKTVTQNVSTEQNIEQKYTIQVQARCTYGDWGGIKTSSYSTPVAPATPTITSAISGNTITFGWSATTTCPTGTTKQYQYRQNGGAWSAITTGTSFAWTNTALGNDYQFEVRARCSNVGVWSPIASKTHSRPSANTGGTLAIAWQSADASYTYAKASGATCTKGTLEYRYKLTSDGGNAVGSSDWSPATTSNTVSHYTAYQGYSYTGNVQARCVIGSDYGNWSATASGSYGSRSMSTPSLGNISTSKSGRTASFSWVEPTCGIGTYSEYRYSWYVAGGYVWLHPDGSYGSDGWYYSYPTVPSWGPWFGSYGGTSSSLALGGTSSTAGAVLGYARQYRCINYNTNLATYSADKYGYVYF